MDRAPALRLNVEALHTRLRERIAKLHPLVVTDVMRVFLDVSSLPCERMLWSLEFAFDEDDGRIARIEARFAKRFAPIPSVDELEGYEVQLLLPNVIPARAPSDGARATTPAPEKAPAPGSLAARFVRELADLGAYHTIEMLEARSAEVYLL
jgi:hypothetical protein